MSTSYSTSRWSLTKPTGQDTIARTPRSARRRISPDRSGPSHSSPVRPALCQAMPYSVRPSRTATASAVSASSRGYGSPDSRILAGRLCALNRTCAPGSSASASCTRPATNSTNAGSVAKLSTNVNAGRPASAAAFSTRSTYCPTLNREYCGARTSPTARSIPSVAMRWTMSSRYGDWCFIPWYARTSRSRRRASSDPTCCSVISMSGERPPIAS